MTTLQLGYTDPRTDAFTTHPVLGAPLDLNDGQTYTLLAGAEGLSLATPVRTLLPAGNIRTQGEVVTKAVYRHNRRLVARLLVGPAADYASFVASIRALLAWVNAVPVLPVTLRYQPFGASEPGYLDVVGAACSIPSDEGQWLRLHLEPVELVFLCRPGIRYPRVVLSNLAMNPGFEAPSGPGVVVFDDPFANANAYATQVGSAPTVSGNVLTIPTGTRVAFGSPAWGAPGGIQRWQVRWQWVSGLTARFYVHFVDNNNYVRVECAGASVTLAQNVGGTLTTLAAATPTLTPGNWYWLQITQFPTPGPQSANASAGTPDPPLVRVSLLSDAAGTPGSAVSGLPLAAALVDATVAVTGRPHILAAGTAALALGGAFSGVHTVSLFGPGGWTHEGLRSGGTATGLSCGAWERDPANTFPDGPTTSYGAARLDLAPAGTIDTVWYLYQGGAPTGKLGAIAVHTAGDTLQVRVRARTAGLGSGATLDVSVREWDAAGGFLRQARIARLTGNQANWTALANSYTTGANCAYADVYLQVSETTAGASANGTVWLDNVQVWNVSRLPARQQGADMPYCELRLPQAPAQLVLSGLQGDLPAPAHLALGTFVSSLAPGNALHLAVGRRGAGGGAGATVSRDAQLVGHAHGFYGAALAPTATAALDASAYGGYTVSALVNPGWNPRLFSLRNDQQPGVYHLFIRGKTGQSAPNLGNVGLRVVGAQQRAGWFNAADGSDVLSGYTGPTTAPFRASDAWTMVDVGQVRLPPFATGALVDPAASVQVPRAQWVDSTGGGGSTAQTDVGWLLPLDGSLLLGTLNNPSNAGFTLTNGWVWAYFDGLLTNRASAGDGPAWTFSVEPSALAAPERGAGGPGTQSSGFLNVNSGADPFLTLDPGTSEGMSEGINHLAAQITDAAAASVLAVCAEVVYAPLYLAPR